MMAAAGSAVSSNQCLTSRECSLIDKVIKRQARLYELCTNPQLALRNSPPYLPDLLAETTALLETVRESNQGSKDTSGAGQVPRGERSDYLRIHLKNLLDKSDRAMLLFKEGGERIFQEKSTYRKNLTKLSLLFSHMLWEMKAMFPDGTFHGDTYTLASPGAGKFWRKSFGNKCIVPWKNFTEQLRSVHAFQEGMESMALKSTVDLTCNNHISVFEFDVFTRLFRPWGSLLKNWNHLAVTHPGYMAFLTFDQVEARLTRYLHRPGSYIFRLSSTRMGRWAIGHVTTDNSIIQTIPEDTPLYQALIKGSKEGRYVYPNGHDSNPDLSSLQGSTEVVKVTEEQYELYCDIGSTFQLCKICLERDKDICLKPCGHLLCSICLAGWQRSARNTCPYCRCKIRSTHSIAIESYRQGDDNEESVDDPEDDHEDIEVIVKKIAALKLSSLERPSPSSRLYNDTDPLLYDPTHKVQTTKTTRAVSKKPRRQKMANWNCEQEKDTQDSRQDMDSPQSTERLMEDTAPYLTPHSADGAESYRRPLHSGKGRRRYKERDDFH